MNIMQGQTLVDISGTNFPKFTNKFGKNTDGFWYVKDEFIKQSNNLLNEGGMFSCIGGRLVGKRWVCDEKPISKTDVLSFICQLRLFYMKSESMSIFSFCTYMEENVNNIYVKKYFRHMRESWEENLSRDANLFGKDYSGPIKTNKQLIDALLYSGNFHSQEIYKKRYDELLDYMDESLILKCAYNAMHSGYQMNQISRSLKDLREDNLVVLLPNHIRNEWNDNRPLV